MPYNGCALLWGKVYAVEKGTLRNGLLLLPPDDPFCSLGGRQGFERKTQMTLPALRNADDPLLGDK